MLYRTTKVAASELPIHTWHVGWAQPLFGQRTARFDKLQHSRKRTKTLKAEIRFPSISFLQKFSKDSAEQKLAQLLGSGSPDLTEIDRLIDELISQATSFRPALLGSGPWEVVYTKGPLLWQKLTNSGSTGGKKSKNQAYQDFDVSSGQVINYGELAGESIYVTAEGTFSLLGQPGRFPVDIEARIHVGHLHVLGKKIVLPIWGKGNVQLVYSAGKKFRIFKNTNGSLSVQQKLLES